jgi:hypothetical protein
METPTNPDNNVHVGWSFRYALTRSKGIKKGAIAITPKKAAMKKAAKKEMIRAAFRLPLTRRIPAINPKILKLDE